MTKAEVALECASRVVAELRFHHTIAGNKTVEMARQFITFLEEFDTEEEDPLA